MNGIQPTSIRKPSDVSRVRFRISADLPTRPPPIAMALKSTSLDPAVATSVSPAAAPARAQTPAPGDAHGDWLGQKVADSLADPRPRIAHAQVMAEAGALIKAKRGLRARGIAP